MPRRRQDPTIRRGELIDAASRLFLSKGYAATSVRDILDEVGNRTASPSVFYYYFKSKEEIYQAVLRRHSERYLQAIDEVVARWEDDPDRLVMGVAPLFLATLTRGGRGNEAVSSAENLLLSLKLREDLTQRFVEVWELFIRAKGWRGTNEEDIRQAAVFVAGGIGEMVYDLNYAREGNDDPSPLMDRMVDFCAGVLGAPEAERQRYKGVIHAYLDRAH